MRIEIVSSNKEKQATYQEQLGRYKKAMTHEFYFEAMLIAYAMLEDRLRSFLYYIGAVRNRNDQKMNVTKTKSVLRKIYFGSEERAREKRLDINKISIKMNLIRATVNWAINSIDKPEEKYLEILKAEYIGCLDLDGILNVLDDINAWTEYRNEIMHGLLNKNLESVNQNLRQEVEKGMRYARFIDGQVKALKKKNRIRNTMKIKQ